MGCGSSAVAAPTESDGAPTFAYGPLRTFDYEPDSVLGEGAFGQVVLVQHNPTSNEYAAKRLKKEQVNEAWLQTEVSILKKCRHPNITFLREVLFSTTCDHVFLIMELARGGSLHDRIEAEKGLPEAYTASILFQIASALDYLHSLAIVHRDMKPENVLLLDEFSSRSLVKLVRAHESQPRGPAALLLGG